MSNIKVGDHVMTKAFLGKVIFATVKRVEKLDDANDVFIIEDQDGNEYNSYGPQLITKKEAKELVKELSRQIDFLKNI